MGYGRGRGVRLVHCCGSVCASAVISHGGPSIVPPFVLWLADGQRPWVVGLVCPSPRPHSQRLVAHFVFVYYFKRSVCTSERGKAVGLGRGGDWVLAKSHVRWPVCVSASLLAVDCHPARSCGPVGSQPPTLPLQTSAHINWVCMRGVGVRGGRGLGAGWMCTSLLDSRN
jgi:hypothetical protein